MPYIYICKFVTLKASNRMKHYDIDINSYIGYPISKGYVAGKLAACKGKPCTVRINSYGGSVMHALDIRQQFRDHGDVTAYVYGMTASAATILAMGAKKIVMSRYAMMLVHRCSSEFFKWAQMNEEELQAYIKKLQAEQADLKKMDGVIANIYAARSGQKVADMAAVMGKGAWMNAEECKDLGLIDEIMEEGEETAITDELREQFVACGLPLPSAPAAQAEEPAEDELQEAKSFLHSLRKFFGGSTKQDNGPSGVKRLDKMDNLETGKENKTTTGAAAYAAIAAALGKDCPEVSADGTLTLTADQLSALDGKLAGYEAAAAKHAEEKKGLEDQVAALQGGDGEETEQVTAGEAGPDEYDNRTSAWDIYGKVIGHN